MSYLNSLYKKVDIRQKIATLDALPAMPIIAQKLLALKLDTEDGENKLMMLIEQDPQISAKILGMANSSMIGAARNITTLRDAAMLLGLKRVQSISIGIAIMSMMAKAPSGKFNMQDLWLHSLGIAFAMLGLARVMPVKMRPNEGSIFLAGMLHDIGYLALAFLDPALSDKLHASLAAEPKRYAPEVEKNLLKICHDELGAELAIHWCLPDEIVAVLRYHHTPDTAGEKGKTLALMINIVERLLLSFGQNEYFSPGVLPEEWEQLGIPIASIKEVEDQVAEQAEQAIQFVSSIT